MRRLALVAMIVVGGAARLLGGDAGERFVTITAPRGVRIHPFAVDRHELTWELAAAGVNHGIDTGRAVWRGERLHAAGGRRLPLLAVNPDVTLVGGRLQVRPGRERHPCRYLTWYGALHLCNWLSERDGLVPAYDLERLRWRRRAGGYRLPTVAEWGLAVRAGAREGTLYAGGDGLDDVAWYAGNAGGDTHPVGQKAPTKLGLHDLSGNVWEWCWDRYRGEEVFPKVASPGSEGEPHAERGGSWFNGPGDQGTDRVIGVRADVGYLADGLRLVRNAGEAPLQHR